MNANWVIIIATVCYSMAEVITTNPVSVNGSSGFLSAAPPKPTIEVHIMPTRDTVEAFLFDSPRFMYGPCSESILILAPDGKTFMPERVEKTKRVVKEVDEPDGYEVKWNEVPR